MPLHRNGSPLAHIPDSGVVHADTLGRNREMYSTRPKNIVVGRRHRPVANELQLVGRSSEPVFVVHVSQAVKLNCIRFKLGWADEQLFTFETVENVFEGIFMLLNSLREYVDVVEVYPYLNTNSFPEYEHHEPLP